MQGGARGPGESHMSFTNFNHLYIHRMWYLKPKGIQFLLTWHGLHLYYLIFEHRRVDKLDFYPKNFLLYSPSTHCYFYHSLTVFPPFYILKIFTNLCEKNNIWIFYLYIITHFTLQNSFSTHFVRIIERLRHHLLLTLK